MVPPPMPTQHERRTATRARILDAAGAVFASRGYDRATLDEIAGRAGVSKGAVYHSFRSKDDLFLALLEQQLGERLAAGPGSATPDAAAAFVDRVGHDPRWGPLFFEFVARCARDADLRPRFAGFLRDARARVEALTGDGQPAGTLTPAEHATVVTALVNGLVLERMFAPDEVAPDLLTRALALLVKP